MEVAWPVRRPDWGVICFLSDVGAGQVDVGRVDPWVAWRVERVTDGVAVGVAAGVAFSVAVGTTFGTGAGERVIVGMSTGVGTGVGLGEIRLVIVELVCG